MLYDVIIVGGGASGLIAACALSRSGKRIVMLEKQPRVGRKLLSTGNGRCNLTHRGAKASDYHGARQAVQSALRAWPPEKIEAFFYGIGVPCTADEAGRVYPMSRQAASVVDALRLYCDEHGVTTLTDFGVTKLTKTADGFEARSADGRVVRGRYALVCTGGLAAPKLGACGDGYKLLKTLGHTLTPTFPAVAALITPPGSVPGLKGVRADGEIALMSGDTVIRRETGEVLFDDCGVSGIAAMQLARQANELLRDKKPCAVRLDLAPGMDAVKLLKDRAKALPQRTMEDFLNGVVHKRVGMALCKSAGLDMTRKSGTLSDAEIKRLAGALTCRTLPVTATQGFDRAQVTAGGASLKDFDTRTLRSLRTAGLYAAGEVLDVDGDCGGFNLQWAWSSALLAVDGILNEEAQA